MLFAVIGIPVGIAYLCQYFWRVNIPVLAQGLGSEYYAQWNKEQKLSEIHKQLQNWEISEQKAEALIKLFED